MDPHTDLSVEEWLKHTRYPDWRKQELLTTWKNTQNPYEKTKDGSYKYGKVKSFVKLESYPEYKHARCINSRHDVFKCVVGPVFRAIDEVVYKNKYFIKKVPVTDRPEYIRQHVYVPGRKYIVTDHSQFEAAFTADLMEDCEFQLYSYLLKNHPFKQQFMTMMRDVVAGTNVCHFKDLVIEIEATRMSGEMCTSLGNGFSNLMSFLFECSRTGATDVRGVVEGDDGLFSLQGQIPSQIGLAENGFTVKMEVVDDFNEASFCGFMFDPDEGINIKTPLELLVNFSWLPAKYLHSKENKLLELYRCKALSYAHQFPGCPVVASFAKYILRMTRGHRARLYWTDAYMRDKFQFFLKRENEFGTPDIEPGLPTRLLFQKKFGITVGDQVRIENYFNNLESWTINNDTLNTYTPTINYNHYYQYTYPLSGSVDSLPPLNFTRTMVERDPKSLLQMRSGQKRHHFWSVPRNE